MNEKSVSFHGRNLLILVTEMYDAKMTHVFIYTANTDTVNFYKNC